jgi:hypothetical protein
VPAGETGKTVYNSHPPLSEPDGGDVSETGEPWKVGDVILYHNLLSETNDTPERKEALETYLRQILKEQMFLSAQSQADALVKEISRTSFSPQNTQMKVLFSIQRMS